MNNRLEGHTILIESQSESEEKISSRNEGMNTVRKNAVLNIIKQVCTIIFPLITFPYATRILHAENYGMFTFASSIVSYFALIAALGISNYAVREGARIRDDNEKIRAFSNQIFTINIISMVTSFVLLALLIVIWRKLDPYVGIILVLSIGMLSTTIGTDWINVIFEDYKYITIRYIVCQSIAVVFLFLLVRKEDDVLWYSFISVLGGILANTANVFYIRRKYRIKVKLSFEKDTWIHLIPILILFTNAIAVTIYIHSDTTILGVLKDDYAVGVYGVASRIYIMVKQVANAAIYVVIPRVASYISQDKGNEIKNLYRDTLGNVLMVLMPALVGLACLSRNIVMLIAGKEYLEATQPLLILSFSLIFASTACLYINGVLIPYRKERIALLLTIVSALINIGLNFILIPKFSFNAAALTTLISEAFMCVAGIIATRKICKIQINRELLLGVISGGIIFLVCETIKKITSQYLIVIALSIVISTAFYIAFMCIVKKNFIYDTIKRSVNRVPK